jgi:hypothetical protein
MGQSTLVFVCIFLYHWCIAVHPCYPRSQTFTDLQC